MLLYSELCTRPGPQKARRLKLACSKLCGSSTAFPIFFIACGILWYGFVVETGCVSAAWMFTQHWFFTLVIPKEMKEIALSRNSGLAKLSLQDLISDDAP
jgi:hypothetical protein